MSSSSDRKKRRTSSRLKLNGLKTTENGPSTLVADSKNKIDQMYVTEEADAATDELSAKDDKSRIKENGQNGGMDEMTSSGKRQSIEDNPLAARVRKYTAKSRDSTTEQKGSDLSTEGKIDFREKSPSLNEQNEKVATVVTSNKSDSLVVLLTQGLHSSDKDKLDTVLNSSDLRMIAQTLRDLSVPLVIPLLKELETRLRTRAVMDIRPWVRWVQVALSMHMPYLTSLPNLAEQLSSLHQWMSGRMEQMSKLVVLQGKLLLLSDQIDRRVNPQSFASQQPAVVFQEESSSESESDEDELTGMGQSGESGEDEEAADWWDEAQVPPTSGSENDDDPEDSESDVPSTRRRKRQPSMEGESDEDAGNSNNSDDDMDTG